MQPIELKVVKKFNTLEEKNIWMAAKKYDLMARDYPPDQFFSYINNKTLEIVVVKRIVPTILSIEQILSHQLNKHEIYCIYNKQLKYITHSTNHEGYIYRYLIANKDKPIFNNLVYCKQLPNK